eukprot:354208-Chlamydomonas_euryale.AAC.8
MAFRLHRKCGSVHCSLEGRCGWKHPRTVPQGCTSVFSWIFQLSILALVNKSVQGMAKNWLAQDCSGYILFCASNMIANGSELLLLTPLAGLVGSVVLPVLGAVPDGAIVLFSGMGPNAQEQVRQ